MNNYIVTVKLPRNPNHDPHNKLNGPCPATGKLCTDVTGEHHSVLIKAVSAQAAMLEAQLHGVHVTRAELLGSIEDVYLKDLTNRLDAEMGESDG